MYAISILVVVFSEWFYMKQVGNHVPYIVENNLEPVPAKSPEVTSDESVMVPPTRFPYQYHVNNVLVPQEFSNPFDEN